MSITQDNYILKKRYIYRSKEAFRNNFGWILSNGLCEFLIDIQLSSRRDPQDYVNKGWSYRETKRNAEK